MNRRRLLSLLACLGLLTGAFAFAAPSAGAVEMCVKIYEDNAQGGDRWQVCGSSTNLGISNLSNYSNGLSNGCNSKYQFRSGWNDCASPAATYTNLPANTRVVFYYSSGYTGGRTGCADANGSGYVFHYDDETTSWRVEGGNC